VATIDELLVKIDASTELLRRELKKGETAVSDFEGKTSRHLGGVESKFAKLGAGLRSALAVFGLGVSVTGIVSFARSALNTAAIGESARAAGVGAERFQRLQFVFSQNGVEANEFGSAMRTLNTRLGQFINTGGGPAKAALDHLGLSQRVLNGEIGDSEALFAAVVKAFEGVTSSAERAALAAALFGREAGAKMQDTLSKGTQALEATAAAANNVFTDDQVLNADALSDAVKRLTTSVGVELKGAFIDFATTLGTAFGVDELQNMEKSIEARLNELQLRENSLRPGTFTGTNEARHRILGEIARERQAIRIEQLSRRPFVTTNPRPWRAPGQESHEGLSDIVVKARPITDATISRGLQVTREMRTELEKNLDTWREAQSLLNLGRITPETAQRVSDSILKPIEVTAKPKVDEWGEAAKRAKEYAEEVERARERQQNLADAIAASFESRGMEALMNGDIREGIRGFAKDLAELVLRMTVLRPLADQLAASLSGIGSSGGGFGGFFKGLFKGKGGGPSLGDIEGFAGGGHMSAGRIGIVGERGPELFVPDVSGRIMNASQVHGAGGGPTIIQHFHVQAGLPPQWEAQLIGVGHLAAGAAYRAVSQQQRGQR